MSRHLKKSYTDLKDPKPKKSNTITFNMADLKLTEQQVDSIRQEAVKAALKAAAPFMPPSTQSSEFKDSFSTFSTFSTFSSAIDAGAKPEAAT